jgi:hypothetical protein
MINKILVPRMIGPNKIINELFLANNIIKDFLNKNL